MSSMSTLENTKWTQGSSGDWIENGDGTWTAEKGDGAETLAQDAGISKERAYEIMNQQGHGTYTDPQDGILKSAVDPGEVVIVPEHVETINEMNQDNTTLKKNNEAISNIEKTVDSLEGVKNKQERFYRIKEDIGLQNDKSDPGTGHGIMRGAVLRREQKEIDKTKNRINKLNATKDSLIKDKERIKNGGN
jgi:hypothetical protein